MIDHLFVYGTLKRGAPNHALVAPFVVGVEVGWLPGALLDLGSYPGWVPGAGRVWGELLRLRDLGRALPLLDHLEEYRGPGDPGNLYQRLEVPVRTARGSTPAWAYRYCGPRGGFRTLPGGTWSPPRRP